LARGWLREELREQVRLAGGRGVVGVELAESVSREKLALGSALSTPEQRGFSRGRLGVPYFVRGALEAERRGWVITLHGAGTAIGPRGGGSGGARVSAGPRAEAQLRLGG
jgi:hypothetical protein